MTNRWIQSRYILCCL